MEQELVVCDMQLTAFKENRVELLIKTNPLIAMQRGFRQHFRSHFAPCSKYCVTVGIKMAPCKTSQESELRRLRTVGTPEPCVSGGRPSCSVADTPWPLTHT